MTKKTIDADAILNRAKPLLHQQALEIQPYGHIVKLPIALSEDACKQGVENLNQLIRTNELQVWFVAEHVATPPSPAASSTHLCAQTGQNPANRSRPGAWSRPVAPRWLRRQTRSRATGSAAARPTCRRSLSMNRTDTPSMFRNTGVRAISLKDGDGECMVHRFPYSVKT